MKLGDSGLALFTINFSLLTRRGRHTGLPLQGTIAFYPVDPVDPVICVLLHQVDQVIRVLSILLIRLICVTRVLFR